MCRATQKCRAHSGLGRKISTLVNGQQPKVFFEIEINATELTSGVYFYKIQTGDFVDTKKMILLR